MSDYGFYLNRARDAAAVVSRLEAAFARSPTDIGLRLTLGSAVRMAERAEQELYSVAAAEHVDVIRYRLIHSIREGFGIQGVAKSLELFQDTVSYIYEAIVGRPRARASLTRETKRESELLFGYSFAGSLGVVMLAPSSRDLFLSKFDEVAQSINQVFDIRNNFELRDAAKKIGPAAVRKLYEWAHANYEAGFDLDLRWTNAAALEAGRYLEAREFGHLADIISLTSDTEESTITVRGILVGFDSIYKTFHLVEPEGSSYKGQLAEDFPEGRDWTVNRRYEATIHRQTTTKYSTGDEAVRHRLASLRPADE